jgi:RNA polymerase sigma-70 factor (ECF subfamily)
LLSPNGPKHAGDPAVLDALIAEYWQPLVAYAQRLLVDKSAAQDVVQRAFIRLWERNHQLPQGDELRPFIYRMVRNLVANEWRRAANHERTLHEAAERLNEQATPAADLIFDAAELEQAILAAVEHLPPRRREVFVLSRFHALSNPQIAEILGISEQTVANQLVSALRTLRELLSTRLEGETPRPMRILRSG